MDAAVDKINAFSLRVGAHSRAATAVVLLMACTGTGTVLTDVLHHWQPGCCTLPVVKDSLCVVGITLCSMVCRRFNQLQCACEERQHTRILWPLQHS